MDFLGILGVPLGYIMWAIFKVIPSYGWALLIFIILTRAVLFPLGIKQQKSTARMAAFQPKLKQLQKQYGKDKNRYQEEMMKLYEQEGISPTAGCLPMVVQMVFLFGIIDVIYKPLQHLLHISTEAISNAVQMMTDAGMAVGSMGQLSIINLVQNGGSDLNFASVFSADELAQIQNFDMNFLGLNLGQLPTQNIWPLIIIPIFAFAAQFGYTLLSMMQQKKNGQNMQGAMKWVMLLMPLLSLYFAFTMPAGVGLYWGLSSLLMILQQLILQKLYPPEKVVLHPDKAMLKNQAKMKARREKMENYQKTMAERGLDAKGRPLAKEVQKPAMDPEAAARERDLAKKRLAEARKRMAEKYGDTPKEDSDK